MTAAALHARRDLQRAEHLYNVLVEKFTLKSTGPFDWLILQGMFHLKLLGLRARGRLVELWEGDGGDISAGGKLREDEGLVFSSNLFLLQDESDGMCLGGTGVMGPCGTGGLWTQKGMGRDTSLVSFLHPDPQAMCLSARKGDDGLVTVEACNGGGGGGGGTRRWALEGRRLSREDGKLCVARGAGADTGDGVLRLQPCFKGHTPLNVLAAGAGDKEGFLLRARNGECFDGVGFASCDSAHARWSVEVQDLRHGGMYSLYKARGGYAGGKRRCLRRTQAIGDGRFEVGLGPCDARGGRKWSLRDGRLSEEEGKRCLARTPAGHPVLQPCSAGHEPIQLDEF
jgi:hypothetical protein